MISRDDDLTLPHPLAHLRAFVLIPWLAVDPDADADGGRRTAAASRSLLAELDAGRPGRRAAHRVRSLARR